MPSWCGAPTVSEVPGVRLELTRPCGPRCLRPLRLPFRHPGFADSVPAAAARGFAGPIVQVEPSNAAETPRDDPALAFGHVAPQASAQDRRAWRGS